MIDCFTQVIRNKGVLSLWSGLAANTIKVQLFCHYLSHIIICQSYRQGTGLLALQISARAQEHEWIYDSGRAVTHGLHTHIHTHTHTQGKVRGAGCGGQGMESNVQCVIHSMNITSKVSKVCLWYSMLHSPITAANVMRVVRCYTNVRTCHKQLNESKSTNVRNIKDTFNDNESRAQLCVDLWSFSHMIEVIN